MRAWIAALVIVSWAWASWAFRAGWVAAAFPSVQTSPLFSGSQSSPESAVSPTLADLRTTLDTYCATCHNQRLKTAGLMLDGLDASNPGAHAREWEKVIARLEQGSMPPPGRPRPAAAASQALAALLESQLDGAWAAHPNPGRIAAVHRLNRTEYNNAIRDLFALDVDLKSLLPGDETADGSFDNFASSLSISPAHLERYASVARQVTRLVTSLPPVNPELTTVEIPLHVIQDDRQSEDLPFGSRGGIAVHHDFPVDGEYLIKVRLQRQYQDYLKGMGWPQKLDIRLDGKLLKRFTVGGSAPGRPAAASYAGSGEPNFAGDPEWETFMQLTGDAGLEVRGPVQAGSHVVGVSFIREMWEPAGLPQPLQRGRVITDDNVYMDYANVHSVQIGGPYQTGGTVRNTERRSAIFVCQPSGPSDEVSCATRILSRTARLAYRRPVTKADVQTLLTFFESGRRNGKSFEAGIQFALERLLVDPEFLLRVYRDHGSSGPAGSRTTAYRLSDLEVASRLSFFLWGSIPDERLLELAEHGQLTAPATLEAEVRRMLADPRAIDTLVNNFAAQWLNLRRVEEVVVDPVRYPNYDLSLMQAARRETELFVGSTIREDRSVVDLLNADYTFVNERLARHYGIPGIYGSGFRRVTVPNRDERGGILAQAALLATASYPDRTSPVLRGKWLLNNILGLPIPPPPPGVDTNIDNKPGAKTMAIRERLAAHRQNAACNSCHAVIDPLGFALENFDVIGGWRTNDETGNPVDTSGTTVGGAKVDGLAGLRAFLLERPEQFPRTVTEKLMAFGFGRMLGYYDRPSVRKIVRDAAPQNYRWSSIILGIVQSPGFLMREPIGLASN